MVAYGGMGKYGLQRVRGKYTVLFKIKAHQFIESH